MQQGMNLSGQLTDWTMDDLIQIVQVTKKTGSLELQGSSAGRIHFLEGQITGAELHERRGIYAGTDPATIADIIYVLSTFDEGTFALGPLEGPDSDPIDPSVISEKVADLQSLAEEVKDEEFFTGVLNVREATDTDVKLTPEQWRGLASLVPSFTNESLEARFGAGGALRLLHTLHSLDLVVKDESGVPSMDTADVDEAGWLDSLARGVSSTDSTEWLEEKAPESTDAILRESVDADSATAVPAAEKIMRSPASLRGVSSDPSATLTDGVFDEIRRLRSKPNG
jgi:hypothetical protein